MKIAIDIDGTITALPEMFKKFMNMGKDCDWEVHILTGSTDTERPYEEHIKGRWKQLRKYNIFPKDADKLHVAIGHTVQDVAREKGKYCKLHNIDLVFEDSDLFVTYITSMSPGTKCFLLKE